MKVLNSTVTMLLSVLMLLSVCMGFVSCAEKEEKYPVAIRVKCDENIYEFPLNVNEISIEREYDGLKHYYSVTAFQLVGHPQYGNDWITPNSYGANIFTRHVMYWDMEGKQDSSLWWVQERGDYLITFHADSTSDLWNFRIIHLRVKVK